MTAAMIEVENLTLTYHSGAEAHRAVDRVSFSVKEGQVYTLLGPSGCGKTTTLRCIAGLERPDSGEIRIDSRPVSSSSGEEWVPPNRRAIGMVFQSYAIWPHMSVFENVAFPLRYGEGLKVPAAEIASRVRKALELVQLGELEDRPAPHLSGGQQQRLALARALVMEPKVLLLDEPLSNLDAKLREEMRGELRRLIKSLGMTAIFVTHEQIEALTLSDVISVMSGGHIIQEGTPIDIYQRPTNPFVANFIGQSNFIDGEVVQGGSDGTAHVRTAVGALACHATADFAIGARVVVAIRPEHMTLSPEDDGPHNSFSCTVAQTSFIGNAMDCSMTSGDQALRVLLHPDRAPPVGSVVALHMPVRHCLAIAAPN